MSVPGGKVLGGVYPSRDWWGPMGVSTSRCRSYSAHVSRRQPRLRRHPSDRHSFSWS